MPIDHQCAAKGFQSTPPGWEATFCQNRHGAKHLNFNPRLPGGRRPKSTAGKGMLSNFNPRLPGGRRQVWSAANVTVSSFQSTPPGWEATMTYDYLMGDEQFQSTPPGWEATELLLDPVHIPGISIHASRVGGDGLCQVPERVQENFNPRLPGGRRRKDGRGVAMTFLISIHASRVGGDSE